MHDFRKLVLAVGGWRLAVGGTYQIRLEPSKAGFFGATPVVKQTISGASDALKIASIISVLQAYGLSN